MQLIEIFKEKDILKQLEKDIFSGEYRVAFTNRSATEYDDNLSNLTESFAIKIDWLKEKSYYPYIIEVLNNFFESNGKQLCLKSSKILAYPSAFDGIVHTDAKKNFVTTITFLNSEWNPTWGGEIICYTDDLKMVIGGVTPQFGKTFIFNGKLPHRAIAPIRASSLLRIVLVAKEKE